MKNKKKTILCLMITLIFLMPLIGNTATATSLTKRYIFCSHDQVECWATYPRGMIDGEIDIFASTGVDEQVQWCDGNNCTGDDYGDIQKVEIRAFGNTSELGPNIILRAVFSNGLYDGDNHTFYLDTEADWSPWYDITDELETHLDWSWYDVFTLDCDVEVDIPYNPPHLYNVYCSMVQIQVTYSP